MEELLLLLKESINIIIRRTSAGDYQMEEILSPVERQQLAKTVQTVRHDLLQAAFFRDPLCRPFVMHALDVILAITRQLHKHYNKIFSGMLSGEPLPVSQQLYEHELECTKLFAWILKTFPDDIESYQPLPPLFRSENVELNKM